MLNSNLLKQILSIPQFEERFFIPNFDYLPGLVTDCADKAKAKTVSRPNYDLNEILLVNLGPSTDLEKPYLILTTDQNEFVVYHLYSHFEAQSHATTTWEEESSDKNQIIDKSRLALRMVRTQKEIICRDLKTYAPEDDDKLKPLDQRPRPTFLKKLKLKKFEKIGLAGAGMYSGVFVSGKTPIWLMMAGQGGPLPNLEIIDQEGKGATLLQPPLSSQGRGKLQQHPMSSDGPITSFAPIHNVNIQHGFVYVSEKGHLRLCHLPAQFNYDAEWPSCKVPLGKTPMLIANHYKSHTYITATSLPTSFKFSKAQYASAISAGVIDEGDEIPESELRTYGFTDDQRVDGMYWPEAMSFTMELVSPVTWEVVDRYYTQITPSHAKGRIS